MWALSSHIGGLVCSDSGRFYCGGDLTASVALVYKHQEGVIVELARDSGANLLTAVEILDDDIYLGAESSFNLFTVRKNSEDTTDEERSRLDVVGGYHLGEFINCFRQGSLVTQLPYSDIGQIPTVMFGTVNGVVGIVAFLPHEQYIFLEKLQSHLRKVIEGVGRLSHQEWRSCNNENKTSGVQNFVDGDLIESLLDLSHERMSDISSAMDSSVEGLRKFMFFGHSNLFSSV